MTTLATPADRRRLESQEPAAKAARQLQRLNALLAEILPANRFYAQKLAKRPTALTDLAQLAEFPFTQKQELAQRGSVYATNLTYDLKQYRRCHQTSGTRGRPLRVLDTADDWRWWIDLWQYPLDAAGATVDDKAYLAFSFGPFIGFWSAFDACAARGLMTIPGGGLSTLGRLEAIESSQATILFCTPSYALHLAEVAGEHSIDVAKWPVRALIVAGEPGGSTPAVRRRIEQSWGATLIDHAGASEVGPWGYGPPTGGGIFVNEADFIAEFIGLETGKPAVEGELSEIVLTSLGRTGSPILRYRTGDLARPSWTQPGDNRFVFLPGGVISRADDMLIIRGVNVFPSSIEQIVRSFPEVVEYRVTAFKSSEMDQLALEVEDHLHAPRRIAEELQLRLGLRIDVVDVPPGSLPRYEGKGRRFVDER